MAVAAGPAKDGAHAGKQLGLIDTLLDDVVSSRRQRFQPRAHIRDVGKREDRAYDVLPRASG